ncbi:Subtilisin inhibitor-like [Streptomyces sp. DvalAA-14]|uniref:SSI family serine proteinase inhibitor n=1 Tax=unclassified Streptomyces TaxID=2593676 RepID=UPI00081B6F13|nr:MULTISPECIES: hypothetical protein [unclassified Streptomyces]MYS19366.1 hypothetical protein [Streptomyces sp. SID4948]SCD42838.1 Subtilisin inhibitor-like [Streptomyces sp. DvalAA-14]
MPFTRTPRDTRVIPHRIPRTPRRIPRGIPHRLTRKALATLLLGAAVLTATPGGAHAIGLPRSASGGKLFISYDDGAGHSRTYRVSCWQRDGGTTGGRVGAPEACRRLREIGGPVGPVAGGQACSMIYGGPQTAEVRGLWDGQTVAESYRRTNGCEVARWARMVPVLPGPDQDTPPRELKG